jgi:cold shock CspA family protein/ribosome-associated translation inhibitor RaiA
MVADRRLPGMDMPLAITYRNVNKTSELDSLIRERAAKLEEFHHHIVSCHVYVDQPQKHQQSGGHYAVKLDIRIPREREIVVKSNHANGRVHDSVVKVITDTFDAAYRKVKKVREIQHRDVKRHPGQEANGIVADVLKDRGYGFLDATDGRKIYFHRNSVLQHRFEDLKPGDSVNFTEQQGNKGPQASTVRLVHQAAV